MGRVVSPTPTPLSSGRVVPALVASYDMHGRAVGLFYTQPTGQIVNLLQSNLTWQDDGMGLDMVWYCLLVVSRHGMVFDMVWYCLFVSRHGVEVWYGMILFVSWLHHVTSRHVMVWRFDNGMILYVSWLRHARHVTSWCGVWYGMILLVCWLRPVTSRHVTSWCGGLIWYDIACLLVASRHVTSRHGVEVWYGMILFVSWLRHVTSRHVMVWRFDMVWYCLFVGCVTSRQKSICIPGTDQLRYISRSATLRHVADGTFYLTWSQHADAGLTIPITDVIWTAVWQSCHENTIFWFTCMTKRIWTRPFRDWDESFSGGPSGAVMWYDMWCYI